MYDDIISLHNQGKTIGAIKRLLDSQNPDHPTSPRKIIRLLREKGATVKLGKRIYTLDESLFDTIDTEPKAYWLGFLYADGCVSKTMRYVTLSLAKVDRRHVESFGRFLKSDQPVKDRQALHKTTGVTTEYSSLPIHSRRLCASLAKLGCTPRKSFTLQFPTSDQVPDHLLRHFVRGYFDGDGSIGRNDGCRMSIVGTKSVLEGIARTIGVAIGRQPTKVRPAKTVYNITFGGKLNTQSVIRFMYDGATIALDRKRVIAESISALPCITKGESHWKAKQYQFWDTRTKKLLTVKNLSHFAKKNGYGRGCLYNVQRGKEKSHKGLIRYQPAP